MPEIRIDPLTGHRAVIAGSADGAPPLLDADSPDPPATAYPDLFWSGAAHGAQEPIEIPGGPVRSLAELDDEAIEAAAERWRERMRAHAGAACLHLAVDQGDGPASAQLFALPFVPAAIARERERFGAYATRTMGANLLGDLVQHEVRLRERIVAIDREAVLMAPFGSRVPYQLLLAPRVPRMRFEDPGPTGARLLRDGLARLGRLLGEHPPLSLWVRTAPGGAEHFCWRIDVLPRLDRAGAAGSGFELGTGVGANPIAPEVAAARLREA
ncbi:MAG TPA: hypothetical protein VKV27_07540 [Solirubrobacteraceae bacterium]|nr:hypothetical protein [Solirubrobacteraceae bacterium]